MSVLTLQNTMNWSRPFYQYAPINAGFGGEPAISIASMIRNSLLSADLSWPWNRNEMTFSTVVGQQDYPQTLTDFGWLEKVSLTDDQGKIWEVKDVYNNEPLAVSASQQRPSAVSALLYVPGTSVKFRFIGVPDEIYTVTLTYQKLSPQFGPYFISQVYAGSGSNTSYIGVFDPYSLPVGGNATISGFTSAGNNGTFVIVGCTSTELIVANSSGVNENDVTGYVSNYAWSPIPDAYSDIYNNLFLAEALSTQDDARAQLYRQRGVAAFLAKAAGLTEGQKNTFVQQWLARDLERMSTVQRSQQGNQARGI